MSALPAPRPTAGFALPSAIFLLVVLAALAAFIVRLSAQQQAGHVADVRGLRAYQAARAGIEWGLFRLLREGACDAASSFNPGGGLSEFTVTVTCSPDGMATANDEAGTGVIVRQIVATACNQPGGGVCPNATPGNNYVERQLSVVAGR
ncbi:MAG: agglutinin biogenesis protein MshP [Pseudomonadota bacterium]